METMEYNIDVEDISDKSFTVKTCFLNYGLGVGVDKNTSYTEKINYKFEFFNDKELKLKLMEIARKEHDNFLIIREIYESSENKDQAVTYISDYVKTQALDLNYVANLKTFINENGFDIYYGICHNFSTTSQIRDWLYKINYDYEYKKNVNKDRNRDNHNDNDNSDHNSDHNNHNDNFINVKKFIDINKIIQCRDMSSDCKSGDDLITKT